jgi:PAS domain S-box-containing protein
MTANSLNFHLTGYHPIEELYRDPKTVVYRAIRTDDKLGQESRSVVIKVLASAYPTDRELANFRHQYTISKNLDLPGVVRVHSLEEYDRGYALVMEDFGGVALDRYCQNHRLSLADILDVAIQLAETIHAIGQQRIVHKDIKPANILINPNTKQVKLIDFSIASLLPRETQEIISPNRLDGTLAYLAPEQTGRMNRGIDYRTDFYSLGVTLYELLTGKLPFEGHSAIELIHCHLAQIAMPVDRVNPDVPSVVAQIVAKLMAKYAEDRYQSALGLKYDLERCLQQFQTTGAIAAFELGERDLSDRFSIPERLYGRESAVAALLDAFARVSPPDTRVSQGHTEMMLVAGCSGIGKTAVINEVYKPITRQHGYFIKGKFDRFNRNIPLFGIVRAFRDLISQLASESDARLAAWRSQILVAVGANGSVLIEAIPVLERIIGKQPAVAELSPTAAQNRFNGLFQKLIEVFTQPEHPLTIFLDDLQWADSASLQLMKLLMDSNKGYLLLLGAYRDNEVSPAHPLMLMVEELKQAQKKIETITLTPLNFHDTNRLIADTLHCSIDRSQPLTELIVGRASQNEHRNTQGNPFFITQFLKSLAEAGEMRFNPEGYWECDLIRIQALAITDDVVAFMAAQLQKLPPATQHALKLAACIGDRFDLDTLAIVSQQSPVRTATDLEQGLEAGLVLPASQIYKFDRDLPDLPDDVAGVNRFPDMRLTPHLTYRFLHDRVQQAAYSLIPESQKQQTHLQIGRLLLADAQAQAQLEKLFEIVNHLNTAIGLLREPADRAMLAQLNLQAARKARAANAYVAACSYARIGTEILGESGWVQQYQLALALHETLAEAAFLSGDFGSVPALVQIVLERAASPIDRVKTYETIIHFHAVQKQYPQAIALGLEILQALGIKLSPKPDRLILLRELVLTKIALWGKSTDRLLALPAIADPAKIAPLRILDLLQAPAFFCSQELMVVLSLVGIKLTLRDGNTPWAAGFYATYCIIISGLGELKQAYRIGELATILADRFADLSVMARVKVVAPWYSKPWQEQLRTTIGLLDESVRMAIDSGNLQYIGINAGVSIATRFYAGIPLDELVDRMPEISALIISSKDENSQQFFDLMRQTIVNLHVTSARPTEIFEGKDELSLISQWQASNEAIILSTMYGFKTLLAYHFEDLPNALIYADAQLPYEYSAKGGYSIARIWMFDALTRLAAYPQSDKQVKKKLLQRVNNTQRELGKRARLMPENFQHQFDLVAAEKYRVLADFTQAIELYDRAIFGAKTNKFLQEEALANELAAKFYLAWGKEKIAATYMQEAYYCYVRWGAKAKTDNLERHYPQLLAPILQAQQSEFHALSVLTTITNSLTKQNLDNQATTTNLDLVSVIQSARDLSSTIELEALIQQLSQIILQNSDAETCLLALPNFQDEWKIRSHSTVTATEILTHQLDSALIDNIEYPGNLIDWVKNTQATIVCDARQQLEITDLYLLEYQPQSVFCLPIVRQSKVLGVLYLEHRHTPNIFTENKQTVISFLCTQAAIALDNANLYQAAHTAAVSVHLQQSYLAALLDNIPHIAWIKDRDSRLIAVNQSYGKLVDRDPIDLVGKTDLDILPVELAQKYLDNDLYTIVSGKRQIVEEKIINAQGAIRWLETIKTPMRNSDGEITGTVGIALDITDRKTIEASLRESEDRYHRMVSNVPGALYQFELAANGTYQLNYVSARFYDMFEISPEAVVGDISTLLDRILPVDRQSFDRSIRKATKLGKSWNWEGRVSLPSGQIRWIRGESRHQPGTDGAIIWDGILMDITDRKNAEHKLEFTQFAVDNSADGIALLRPDGSFAYANKAMCRMLGYSLTELDTMQIWDIDDETSPDTWPNHWRKLKATGGFSVETHHQSKDNRRYPVEINLNFFEFEGEEYNFSRVRDVTDSKAAELALRESEERYQKLSDNIPGVIYQFRLAPDGSITYPYVSSGCWELFQLDAADIMADAKCAIETIHPDDLFGFQQIVAKSAQNMTPKLWEGRVLLRSGEIKWIKSVSRPTRQPDGAIVWDGVMLDTTDRKQAEVALLATNQELQHATRLKDEFLATMSHELRTPLNAILGMSEALQDEIFGTLNPRQINAISTIEQSGEHLLSVINDILDVSKISAGKLELNITNVSLAELCRSSLILVKQQAINKQIHLDTDLPANLDRIAVDERRMRQVLINLLNNAVKFTPKGGKVRLKVSSKSLESYGADCSVDDRLQDYCLCFSVDDTGIGISSTDLSKLFQPFVQIDSSLSRKYPGTGLGLVLVKQIVELHGGHIAVDSKVGKGSCFTVMLPQTYLTDGLGFVSIDTSTHPEPSRDFPIDTVATIADPSSKSAPLVLLAENNQINIDTFASYLTAKGYRTILARTGQEAISLTQIHYPDLVLIDIQLPDLDGIAASEWIRQQPHLWHIPIIALTALATNRERDRCLAVGVDRYLPKPVKLRELHDTIQTYLDLN